MIQGLGKISIFITGTEKSYHIMTRKSDIIRSICLEDGHKKCLFLGKDERWQGKIEAYCLNNKADGK